MTDLEKLEAAEIRAGDYINIDTLVDSLSRDGFVATSTKVNDKKEYEEEMSEI